MESNFMSLFDYLKRPAGSALGAKVGFYAKSLNEETDTRQVSTNTYTGAVKLYNKAFLDKFFGDGRHMDLIEQDYQAYLAKKRK